MGKNTIEDSCRTGNFDSFEIPGKKRYLVLFKRYVQECFLQGMNLADQGLSAKATMDQLEHVLTGPAYNKNRLEIIARTNATTAFNQGRLEMFNQAADFVPYVEFLAILDSRTTDICEARNGKIFKTGGADVAANTLPLHYRCRSILSPVTTYDIEDMQKAGWKDPDGNTLQQKMDLSGMPELPKGFGDVGRNAADVERSFPNDSAIGGGMPRLSGHSEEETTKKIIARGNVSISLEGFKPKPPLPGDIAEEDFIESIIEKIPASHLDGIRAIKVSYNQVFLSEDVETDVIAKYRSNPNEITLGRMHAIWEPRGADAADKSTRILFHEVGHHVHVFKVSVLNLKEIEKIAASSDNTLANIKYKDANEFFAEAYVQWSLDKASLYNSNEVLYNIIETT